MSTASAVKRVRLSSTPDEVNEVPAPETLKQEGAPANPPASAATTSPTYPVNAAPTLPTHKPTTYYRAQDGEARFMVVKNDNSERNLMWLMALKEIFARQLPKMPREYIVRLVMDRSHHSLVCLEGETEADQIVVGGITMRAYPEQRFAEIAFCAVSATHQVKGYGTRLMNQLKEFVKREGLTHFLTYADNFAIGYFKKQGFTSTISMPRERWVGYIKDYDGGTLMECVVNPRIDYLNVPSMIQRQRAFLLEQMLQLRKLDAVYPGLDATTLTPNATSQILDAYDDIPGIKEAGWKKPLLAHATAAPLTSSKSKAAKLSAPPAVSLTGAAGAELQSALRGVVDQVSSLREAWPFHEPVPASVVDYLEIIHEPIDLSLIRQRVDSGDYYTTAQGLRRDLTLMVDNCMLYNHPDTLYYKAANAVKNALPALFGDAPEAGGAAPSGAA